MARCCHSLSRRGCASLAETRRRMATAQRREDECLASMIDECARRPDGNSENVRLACAARLSQ
eukprot:6393049-Alexandrium_andersonii.AAC.1